MSGGRNGKRKGRREEGKVEEGRSKMRLIEEQEERQKEGRLNESRDGKRRMKGKK